MLLCNWSKSNTSSHMPELKLGISQDSPHVTPQLWETRLFEIYFQGRDWLAIVKKEERVCLLLKSYQTTVKSKHPICSRYFIIDNHFFSRKNIGRIINTITFLSWKYARLFVLEHYQSLKANSFTQALLSQTHSHFITNSIRGHCLCQLGAFVSGFPWLLANYRIREKVYSITWCFETNQVWKNIFGAW